MIMRKLWTIQSISFTDALIHLRRCYLKINLGVVYIIASQFTFSTCMQVANSTNGVFFSVQTSHLFIIAGIRTRLSLCIIHLLLESSHSSKPDC